MRLFVLLLFLCPLSLSHATEVVVQNIEELEAAMESIRPGDTVVMSDGVWTDAELVFAGHGTKTDPITLRAQTPGGVTLTGRSNLSISGSHLMVSGLNFVGGAPGDLSHVIQFRGPLGDAVHCRLTNTQIKEYNPEDPKTRYFWVSLYGQHNRVDHCRFKGQNHSGVTVCVWVSDQITTHHRIDNNHFLDRPPGDGNGFETIRIGTSTYHETSTAVLVERNLFERVDGEIEIISNKACDNVFRANTFRESAGTLTLRHGHRALVEQNYFLGNEKPRSGGIRIIGEDHVIRNNYIAQIDDRMDGAISFAAGIVNTKDNGYEQVKRVRIENNTIIDVKGAAITFDWGIGERNRSLLPEALVIANNMLYSTHAPIFEGGIDTDWKWINNVVYGAPLGISPREGVQEVELDGVVGSDGLWRISGSPAFGRVGANLSADSLEPLAPKSDTGLAVLESPLTYDDVGPDWGGE
ncbi:polysaccharide lyase 6 family protein [Algisphaera agarilytica]|uniref:Poly(Beta-D-mannuronate) lyase n=1 Tax=Algisphaera agarilytica TaxID=1385975 RepID=A0A7X0LJ99_9BACT|nr:polysaccharide lyase 6 family protein [Algisphaera agarilytica]MBB6428386.1 poly(beta-D-mannuronate) lyase [Algisphaera agarilytica]